MTKEDPIITGLDRKVSYSSANLHLVPFPTLILLETELQESKSELHWLRKHVDEGVIEPEELILHKKTVFVDTQPCPQFLNPYNGDEDWLGPIIKSHRQEGHIPSVIPWGVNEMIELPADSRWGLTVNEIETLIIPDAKKTISSNSVVRLPTIAELLHLRNAYGTFNESTASPGQVTKEWSSSKYSNLGNLFLSGGQVQAEGRKLYWWPDSGPFNRLPTLGFRLVVETE